jgi:CheY-like chemotaxis protein
MAGDQPSVLLVDDSEINRALLTRWFTKNDFRITTATSGQEGLDLLERESFSLVLLDVEMPGVNGLEVLMQIRETHSLQDLPVIMVTGRDQTGDHVAALRLGANDYVAKPFNLALILARVRNLLATARPAVATTARNTGPLDDSGEGETRHARGKKPASTGDPALVATVPGETTPLAVEGYEILGELGRGGMGVVYKARHVRLGRLTALKVIRPEFFTNPGAVERFYREARAVALLQHPNIVLAYDAGQAGPTHYLSMEYIEGGDLGRRVADHGRLGVGEACEFVRQAALALQHLHGRGLVHRDVKPSNLLVAGTTLKLADFGLSLLIERAGAAIADGSLTGEGRWVGSADYIAPEQCAEPHRVDARADLYSLGCTLYHLLTGRVPFPNSAVVDKILRHSFAEAEPVDRLRPEAGEAVTAIVKRLMAKRPDDRFQTSGEVAEALRPLASLAGPLP